MGRYAHGQPAGPDLRKRDAEKFGGASREARHWILFRVRRRNRRENRTPFRKPTACAMALAGIGPARLRQLASYDAWWALSPPHQGVARRLISPSGHCLELRLEEQSGMGPSWDTKMAPGSTRD